MLIGVLSTFVLLAASGDGGSLEPIAAPAKTVAAVLPPRTYTPEDEALGWLIQDRATALLQASGHYTLLHLKQIRRMAESEGISTASLDEPRMARLAGTHLGADRLSASTLLRTPEGWSLTFRASVAHGDWSAAESVALPDDWAQAVMAGGRALAQAVGKLDGVSVGADTGSDLTHSSAAMRSYAECFQVLVRQPMGIENPDILLKAELQGAVEQCREAVQADPAFAEAKAALALALAIGGEDSEARAELKGLSHSRTYLPLGWVAWFWLRTRMESGPAGTETLRKAIAHDPDLLLFRGYLAEHLNALHQQKDALEAWRSFVQACPNSPFGLARLGYTLARLGDHPGAEAATLQALSIDPESRAAHLELAGRQIDAGQLDKAEATLKEMVRSGGAGAEAYLRLGFAELRSGELDAARADLEEAISLAQPAAQWRTRARAELDLARISEQQGRHDAAVEEMRAALREGYKSPLLEPEDPLVIKLSAEAERKEGGLRLSPHPPEASPYQLDPAGNARPIPDPQAGIPIIEF